MTSTTISPHGARIAASNAASTAFFDAHAEHVAHACEAMAARFRAGGRLLVCGAAAQRSDVAHVVVEFLHPVIVGKRALPALAVPDAATLAAVGRDADLLMLLAAAVPSETERRLVSAARARGLKTIALTGAPGAALGADFHFAVPSDDPCVVQEVHEMLYHVLWELVHVFLDHHGGRA